MAVDLNMNVLIVDDYQTMLRILRNLLRQLNFKNIDEASDGSEALKKLRAKSFGLVISDWNMEPMTCLLYTSPSPRDRTRSRMPSSA